jgi:hypothetical protein
MTASRTSAAASRSSDAASQPGPLPQTVLALSVVQGIEAVGVLLASVLAAIDTASGKSYELASGIAITVIGFAMALALGLVARGLWAGRRWTRTPTLLTQLFVGFVGILMIQAARYSWGIPALLLAVAGFAMLFAPASTQVLTPGRAEEPGRG